MSDEGSLTVLVFVIMISACLLGAVLIMNRRSRLDNRLKRLGAPAAGSSANSWMTADPAATSSDFTRTTLPRMGEVIMPTSEKELTLLRTRLVHAGLYGRQVLSIFLGVKLLLMTGPALVGLLLGLAGVLPLKLSVLGGACLGIMGMIGPSFWLDKMKQRRQARFRRSLPDALDLLVICLEGGLSLQGGLKRVGIELATAHPTLAVELSIVQREMQMGRTPGEALAQMGLRTDLDEVRGLSSVIAQAERFGASLVKSLRTHADSLRHKRQQMAEEMAQKAATKILFPTILFIFPAIFVVILAPAVFQLTAAFSNMPK